MSDISLLTLIVVSGILLSLNPFSIAVFSALLAGALGKGHPKSVFHTIAMSYLISYAALLTFFGMALVGIFSLLPYTFLLSLSLAISVISIFWGIVTIANFFWYGTFDDVPKSIYNVLHKYSVKKNSPGSAAYLGLIAASSSFVSNTIMILSFVTIVSLLKTGSPSWMLLLAIILIIPLIIILISCLNGTKISTILKWKEDSKAIMRLSSGLTYILIGWIILLILNGTIGSIL